MVKEKEMSDKQEWEDFFRNGIETIEGQRYEIERLQELLVRAGDYLVHELSCPDECIKCEAEAASGQGDNDE
jgi:hypothetical protein